MMYREALILLESLSSLVDVLHAVVMTYPLLLLCCSRDPPTSVFPNVRECGLAAELA